MTVRRARRVLVLAPSSFGAHAEDFAVAALSECRGVARCDGGVVDDLRAGPSLRGLRAGDVVLTGIGSDLALLVSAWCRERGVAHVASGATSDRLSGSGTVRLTPGARELARRVRALVGARRPVLLVAEPSPFGAAVEEALRRVLPRQVTTISIDEALHLGTLEAVRRTGARSVVAALRPPHPERLAPSLSDLPADVALVATGSWTRPEVGAAVAPVADRLRIVDLPPSSLLAASRLAPDLRPILMSHRRHPWSIYRDMGWAAGVFLARHVLGQDRDVRATLRALDLQPRDVVFGHGFRLDRAGENVRARRAVLAWRDGAVVRADVAA